MFVHHIVCNSSFIYQITQPPNSLFEPMELGVYPNKFGIIRELKLSGFSTCCGKVGRSKRSVVQLDFLVSAVLGLSICGECYFVFCTVKKWRVVNNPAACYISE